MAFKIYTKTGDRGETSLFGGSRLPKSHLRIEAYGTVDELNAHIGWVRDNCPLEEVRSPLLFIQELLFVLGARLAAPPGKETTLPGLSDKDVHQLEDWIDLMEGQLPPLQHFILPGGHPLVSSTHIARCVCRRAERLVVALDATDPLESVLLVFLNRLSDYLFVLARYLALRTNTAEIPWIGKRD